jgi:hypothetical protein
MFIKVPETGDEMKERPVVNCSFQGKKSYFRRYSSALRMQAWRLYKTGQEIRHDSHGPGSGSFL